MADKIEQKKIDGKEIGLPLSMHYFWTVHYAEGEVIFQKIKTPPHTY